MAFLRHVGKIGDRKVVVVFRELPGEEHMCLVVYTEIINAHLHDAIMQCLESDIGQSSENFADALNRTPGHDGKYLLQTLHYEGKLKKIQTDQVVMTPTPTTRLRLNELNSMLNEMAQGEAAVKKMAEMDASMGLQDPKDVARRMRGETPAMDRTAPPAPLQAGETGALDDAAIANNLRQQAEQMKSQAEGLMAEVNRLLNEAQALAPVKATKAKTTKKVTATTAEAPRKVGRPRKNPV